MTHFYTIDHARITGYLHNYDPIKQYFCLLPYNYKLGALIVPQEYIIHFDDFLLPCNIPTQIDKPLTAIKHLVSSPLYDKDKSYYTALAKQSQSYNDLFFISAKIISNMVQTEHKAKHKPPPIEHTSFETLPNIFHQFSVTVLFEIQLIFWTRTKEIPLTLSS